MAGGTLNVNLGDSAKALASVPRWRCNELNRHVGRSIEISALSSRLHDLPAMPRVFAFQSIG